MRRHTAFDKAFEQFLFQRVQKEADDGCSALSEPAPSTLVRQDIETYSTEEHYATYVSTFPTIMTTMAAVVSKDHFDDGAVQVLFICSRRKSQTCLFSCQPALPSTGLVVDKLTTAGHVLQLPVASFISATPNRSGSWPHSPAWRMLSTWSAARSR